MTESDYSKPNPDSNLGNSCNQLPEKDLVLKCIVDQGMHRNIKKKKNTTQTSENETKSYKHLILFIKSLLNNIIPTLHNVVV